METSNQVDSLVRPERASGATTEASRGAGGREEGEEYDGKDQC